MPVARGCGATSTCNVSRFAAAALGGQSVREPVDSSERPFVLHARPQPTNLHIRPAARLSNGCFCSLPICPKWPPQLREGCSRAVAGTAKEAEEKAMFSQCNHLHLLNCRHKISVAALVAKF